MNKKYSVAAFSIIETVVSLVITAIVMGLIFLIFSILSERMIDFKQQNEDIADLNRRFLKIDFYYLIIGYWCLDIDYLFTPQISEI